MGAPGKNGFPVLMLLFIFVFFSVLFYKIGLP